MSPVPLVKRGIWKVERERNKDGIWRRKRKDFGKKRAMQGSLPSSNSGQQGQNIESREMVQYPKVPDENNGYWDTIPGKLSLALNDEVLGVSSKDTEQFIEPITKMMNQLSDIEKIINEHQSIVEELRQKTYWFPHLFDKIREVLYA